jgi:hypothetical protein
VKRALLLVVVAACAKFEDPAVVVDLRPIAIDADRPEQVIDIDENTTADQILLQLHDTNLGILLSDLNFDRRIRWSAEVCNLQSDGRCDHDAPYEMLGSGVWDDPDTSPPPSLTITADGNLLGILYDELQNDTLHGLGGEYFGLSLKIGGEDADPDLDQYLGKEMLVSPRIPADRTPNQNPTIDHIDTEVDDDASTSFALPLGRCSDLQGGASLVLLHPGDKLRLEPIELPTTRETYSVPTIDGSTRTFTEAVTYQWLATAGRFSDAMTGGGHDPFGNLAPVHTEWTAPTKVTEQTNIWLWIVQRDERLGVTWYQACVTVTPE